MRRIAILVSATLLVIALWATLMLAALDQGWGHRPLTASSDPADFADAARDIAARENVGNLAFILIEDGDKADSFNLSRGAPVDEDTVFQVASLGKWITAWGVMKLVEQGKIDLDAPVSTYLTRWQLPESEFDADGVTVRRLLSHTAGLDDGLGYDGFENADQRQTLEASLTRALDASPDASGRVRLGAEPGSGWRYSGGGYTLLQLLVEEVSGMGFAPFMDREVFTPLGMTRTTFDHACAIRLGLAENYRPDGTTEPFRWYTALAATSLFTTTADLARFVAAQAPDGDQPVLSKAALAQLRSPHAASLGADIWGIGPMLFAPNGRGDFIIGHDGANAPAINTSARLDPDTGDGIVILATGNPSLATELAGEWVFWKTGEVDSLTFASRMPSALLWFAIGCVLIVAVAGWLGWRGRSRTR